MKYLLILTLLAACSSKQPGESKVNYLGSDTSRTYGVYVNQKTKQPNIGELLQITIKNQVTNGKTKILVVDTIFYHGYLDTMNLNGQVVKDSSGQVKMVLRPALVPRNQVSFDRNLDSAINRVIK